MTLNDLTHPQRTVLISWHHWQRVAQDYYHLRGAEIEEAVEYLVEKGLMVRTRNGCRVTPLGVQVIDPKNVVRILTRRAGCP